MSRPAGPDPGVRLQERFTPAIDPDRSAPGTWEKIAAGFEHAARAPGPRPHPPLVR
ncbi:hypothetical protein [Streptomyces sp. NPDC017095]|uniref:hypothetical protein n=1 Tax=Streptomyces sp. NPDC017095 TaxID=3364977 RepID=UPI0037B7849A